MLNDRSNPSPLVKQPNGDVLDSSGNIVKPGQTVAFHGWGGVVLGRVVKINEHSVSIQNLSPEWIERYPTGGPATIVKLNSNILVIEQWTRGNV